MSWQSNHDILTGLPNRSALAVRFEQEIALARDDGHLLAVCLFDLDHFQQINQTLGQDVGNDILKQAASRLHDFAGRQHYVARLGGDEFVLLLPALADHAAVDAALAQVMAQLALDYHSGAHTVSMSASAGVALYSGAAISADQLLRHADQALYQAKITGRNRYHLFDSDLDEQIRTHHNRRTEARDALFDGALRLYYQPKLDMRKGRIIGMEALLRWQHPQRGVVAPMEFLPIVEHSDIIVDIGEWVLREALRQLQQWRAREPHWVVSVNIAARHFQRHDFVERLTAILAEFPDVPPHMLELEILESSALNDIGHVRAIMLACQSLGISFALDDFGTGYSSMAYLKHLPACVLKIDQSFVRNMLVERDDPHWVSINLHGMAPQASRTGPRRAESPASDKGAVDQLYPVFHRRVRARLQMDYAADVGRDDGLRAGRLQMGQLAVAQLQRQLLLQDRIGAGRAAAQMTVGAQHHIDAGRAQQAFDLAAYLLAMLQGAWRVIGDFRVRRADFSGHAARQLLLELRHHLAQVARQRRNTPRLFRIGRIVRQQVAVFLDRHAATGRRHHDRLHRLRAADADIRPPRVDITAHIVQARILVVEMVAQRAATAGAWRDDQLHAQFVEHARRRRVDVGRHGRLHAACQHQHLARVRARRTPAGRFQARDLVLHGLR